MKILFMFLPVLFLSLWVCAQQKNPVSGKIISATHRLPLGGATIHVEGSKASAVASGTGTFYITVQPGENLVITHIGYDSKTITIDSVLMQPLIIELEENSQVLGDIEIATGYQHLSKLSVTGSYETIDNNLLNRKTGTSLLERLDGVAGSLFFDRRAGTEAPLRIRGLSTLDNSATDPLIILNNFPYDGDINNINPEDVENITILKDAAAAAIWGAKAANGVIVITTKKGKFKQPFALAFHSNVTLTSKPNIFQQKSISVADYIEVEEFLFKQGFYDGSLNNTYNYPPISSMVQILAKQREGSITETEAMKEINILRQQDVRNDFTKYLYRQGTTQQYSLAMSGGSENYRYRLSGGYDRTAATLTGNQNERLTIRTENSFIPIEKVNLDFSLSYTKSNNVNNSPGGYNDILIGGYQSLYPYLRFADDQGHPIWLDYMYSNAFTDTAGTGRLLNWKYNPIDELGNVNRTITANDLAADIGLRYSFSKFLNAEVKYHYQSSQSVSSFHYNVNSFMARNYINQFTQINGNTVTYIIPFGGILDQGHNRLDAYASRAQLNFSKTFMSSHKLNLIVGGEIRQARLNGNSFRTYGYDERLNHSAVDYVNYYPTFGNIAGQSFIPNNDGFSRKTERYVSTYANTNYSFKNTYLVSASYRKDASNLFGVNANQRGVPLWSAGAGWNMSNESFYHLLWLPYLKLRTTFGYSGNVSHAVSALTTLVFNPGIYQPVTNLPYANIQNYPNPNLQWEKVGVTNIGLDFITRNERVRGSIEYFYKYSTNLLASQSLDPTVGATFLTTNSAEIKGKGLDIIINSKNIDFRSFTWESAFTFSSIRNKLTRYLHLSSRKGFVSNGEVITPLPGYTPYEIVSYKWAGLDENGNPLGYVNGKPSMNYDSILSTPLPEQEISGSAVPTSFGALRNTFTWKGLSFSFNISYRLGYYFRQPTLSYYYLFYNGKAPAEFADRWQKPGDELRTSIPAMSYPLNSSSDNFYQYAAINVRKADHVRLNDVRLGYETPSEILEKLPFKRLNFFCYIGDINFLIWKANKEGIDPEFRTGLKTPVSFSFGINTNF